MTAPPTPPLQRRRKIVSCSTRRAPSTPPEIPVWGCEGAAQESRLGITWRWGEQSACLLCRRALCRLPLGVLVFLISSVQVFAWSLVAESETWRRYQIFNCEEGFFGPCTCELTLNRQGPVHSIVYRGGCFGEHMEWWNQGDAAAGLAAIGRIRASLDADGRPLAFDMEGWFGLVEDKFEWLRWSLDFLLWGGVGAGVLAFVGVVLAVTKRVGRVMQ